MTIVSPTRTSLSTVNGKVSPAWWVLLFTSWETARVIGTPEFNVSNPASGGAGA